MATVRTCPVTDAIIPMVVRSSTPAAATKIMEKGISKSTTLQYEEACKIDALQQTHRRVVPEVILNEKKIILLGSKYSQLE